MAPDLWVPMMNEQQIDGWNYLDSRGDHTIFLLGRLKPGVRAAEAEANLNVIAKHLGEMYPNDDQGLPIRLTRPGLVGDTLGRPVRAFLGGRDAAGGPDFAGGLRQSGQPVCGACGGPVARNGDPAGAGVNARAHFAATAGRGRDGRAGGRRVRSARSGDSAALAERMACAAEFSDSGPGESGCDNVCSGAAAVDCGWFAVRHYAGSAGAALGYISTGEGGSEQSRGCGGG